MKKMMSLIAYTLMAVSLSFCAPHLHEVPQGTASGGGGFAGENSKLLIEKSSKELAQTLRAMDSRTFVNLPQGWSQEKMAQIVERIKLKAGEYKSRHDKKLIMDYGVDPDTNSMWIGALGPFFDTYNHVPIEYENDDNIYKIIKDIHKLYLHELAHLIFDHAKKYNEKSMSVEEIESQSRAFARDTLNALDHDLLACEAKDVKTWPSEVNSAIASNLLSPCFWGKAREGLGVEEYRAKCDLVNFVLEKRSYRFLISRTRGFGMYHEVHNDLNDDAERKCKPRYGHSHLKFDPSFESEILNGLNGTLLSGRQNNNVCEEYKFIDFKIAKISDNELQYSSTNSPIGGTIWSSSAREHLKESLTIKEVGSDVVAEINYSGQVSTSTDPDFMNNLIHTDEGFMSAFSYVSLEERFLLPTPIDEALELPSEHKEVFEKSLKELRSLVPKPGESVKGKFELDCQSHYLKVDLKGTSSPLKKRRSL